MKDALKSAIKLGLDLRGGIHLVLQVNTADALKAERDDAVETLKNQAKDSGLGAVEGVVGFLGQRFTDHSQALTRALHQSNAQAWKALEIALAGDSFWDRCKMVFSTKDDKAFREQLRPFLDACPMAELSGKAQFRQDALRELKAAGKANLLTGGALDPRALAREAASLRSGMLERS